MSLKSRVAGIVLGLGIFYVLGLVYISPEAELKPDYPSGKYLPSHVVYGQPRKLARVTEKRYYEFTHDEIKRLESKCRNDGGVIDSVGSGATWVFCWRDNIIDSTPEGIILWRWKAEDSANLQKIEEEEYDKAYHSLRFSP